MTPLRNNLRPLILLGTLILGSTALGQSKFEDQPWGYLGRIELDNRDLEVDDGHAYRGWFDNTAYQGDLVQYRVFSGSDPLRAGDITTTIDLSGPTAIQTAVTGGNWSARLRYDAAIVLDADWWRGGSATRRKIITGTGLDNTQRAFQWANLTDAEKLAIDRSWSTDTGTCLYCSDDGIQRNGILDFLRGDRSREVVNGGNLRSRASILGDIVHSNPVYVGAPDAAIFRSSYITFAATNQARAGRVYVGANDGMLHAYNAITGDEVYAFVPTGLIPQLSTLASTAYDHRYYVDGGITVADVEFNADDWHTVLVGGLGAGGRGVYVLDVTSPDLNSEGAATGDDLKVVSELTGDDDVDIGHIHHRPVLARFADGDWYAVFGNGFGSDSGAAKLIMLNLRTLQHSEIAADNSGDNGLSGPVMADTDGDGFVDIAYAGDLSGRIWRFEFPVNDSGSLKPTATSILSLPTRSFTATPDVTRHPFGGLLVTVATGRLLTEEDALPDSQFEFALGLRDVPGSTPPRFLRFYGSILDEEFVYDNRSAYRAIRSVSGSEIEWAGENPDDAWLLVLEPGMRVVQPLQIRGGRVRITAINPQTEENWTIEPDVFSGSALGYPVFDINGDGQLKDEDLITDSRGNDAVPMAWRMPDGLVSHLAFARLSPGRDTAYFNHLVLPANPVVCTGYCPPNGLEGGELDLVTDAPAGVGTGPTGNGFGNAVSVLSPAYDDSFQTTQVDLSSPNTVTESFGVSAPSQPAQFELRDVISDDKVYIVAIANADLSAGATLTLGDRTWDAADYQARLHRALRDWDGNPNALTDADGNSLLYRNVGSGNAIGLDGQFGIGFDSDTLRSAGLHPTLSRCVAGATPDALDPAIRWRNGALTLQLIDWEALQRAPSAGGGLLGTLTVQTPDDLRNPVILADGSQVLMSDATDVYGGVRVPGVSDVDSDLFLYEAAVYWDYPGSVCYGETPTASQGTWGEQVAFYVQGLTELDFFARAGITATEFRAVVASDSLDCSDVNLDGDSDDEEACALLFRNWRKAGELLPYVNTWRANPGGIGEGFGDLGGDELGTGLLTPLPPLSPANYRAGRQGWSDVTEE